MLGVLSGVLSKVFISWPANNEVKNAVMGRMMANGRPMSEYVAAMESTPVSGVAMRNDTVAPLEAPSLRSPMAVGITPHEHKGSGTPNSDA